MSASHQIWHVLLPIARAFAIIQAPGPDTLLSVTDAFGQMA